MATPFQSTCCLGLVALAVPRLTLRRDEKGTDAIDYARAKCGRNWLSRPCKPNQSSGHNQIRIDLHTQPGTLGH